MVTTLNDRLDYFGTTVEAATQMLELSAAGELLVSKAIIDSGNIAQLLSDASRSVEVVAQSPLELIVQRYVLPGAGDRG